MFIGNYVQGLRGGNTKIETFPCPTCHSEFTLKPSQDVAELASSYFIKNMLEIMAIQEKAKALTGCSRCQNASINHCMSCKLFLCKRCSGWHDSWPANKNHDVFSVEELNNPKIQVKMRRKLHCSKHENEVLKYYCETCKELCCIDCVVLYHQKPNHSCLAVSDVTEKQREALQLSCTTLQEKLFEGKNAMDNICKVMKSLEQNAKTAKDQIKKQKESILKILTEKLDEKAEKMNGEVDKIYLKLHGQLSKQLRDIEDYVGKVQTALSLPGNLLTRGSIEEILSSQKLIDENVEKLGNLPPEDLDVVNDCGIHYVPDDTGNMNVDEILAKLGYVEGM